MKQVGEISSILNNSYLLAKTTEPLKKGDKLYVYQILTPPNPEKVNGLKQIVIPKGKLIVLEKQAENIYLLAVSVKKETKTVYSNNLFSQFTGYTSFLGTPERITEVIPEEDTRVDEAKSLNFKINPAITIGDIISKE